MPHELDKTAFEADPAESPQRAASSAPEGPETAPSDTPVSSEVEPPPGPDTDTALVPTDSLSRYMAEIRRYPLLSPEEEHDLAVRYKEYGEVQAAYRLVTANLRLVVMIARKYQRAFRNLLDLIQEGNVGLMEAVRNFDPYRGVRFPSYAVWWVRAYIIRYVMNNWRMVKIGTTQAQRKLFFNLERERKRLEAEGFSPGPKLLAQNLGVKEEEVVEMQQRLSSRDLSVDTPLDTHDESSSMLDFLADPQATVEEEVSAAEYRALVREQMDAFAQTLSGKDAVIFHQRLLAEEPLTLQEIGDQYSISRERVRQLESRLKKRLKAHLIQEFTELRDLDVAFADHR
ncbi:MAG: RNA polymerase factor sigma-32 [Desulfurellaceae bacterium]|nr:RNA polymerase factor sigma-32 [Desulfurellaceae bacterium]